MDTKALPPRPNLEQYKKQAKDLLKTRGSKDLKLAGTQFEIAREHGFQTWPEFARHIAAMNTATSRISQFETAAEAVIEGDLKTLESLLQKNPALVRARSTRQHQATLLHYVAANGIEDYRQKSPPNAPLIAATLLKAGAEVDALALAYGTSTTLSLVTSSFPPEQAGVQVALIEILLHAGANIDTALMSAINNGRLIAAEALVQRGAPIDNIIAAAALGHLVLIQQFLTQSTQRQIEQAFIYACLYGQTSIADFLLQSGVDPAAGANTGQTGMHFAAHAGHLETVQLLIERNVPLDVRNRYGGTVLGQAMWSATHEPKPDHLPIIEALRAAGAKST